MDKNKKKSKGNKEIKIELVYEPSKEGGFLSTKALNMLISEEDIKKELSKNKNHVNRRSG